MDGSLVSQMANAKRTNWLIDFLMRLEKKYYQQLVLPELLIVLKVHPETAVRRKPEEDAASVRARSAEIWELDWGDTPAHFIDASRPRAEVLSELKALIWSEL